MPSLKISCMTCEFFKNGVCMSHKSEYGYGQRVSYVCEDKSCWSISLEYFSSLVSSLPAWEQENVRNDEQLSVYELLERMETGEWNSAVRKRHALQRRQWKHRHVMWQGESYV